MELMSSEESGDDDDTIVVKLLGWRLIPFWKSWMKNLHHSSLSRQNGKQKNESSVKSLLEQSQPEETCLHGYLKSKMGQVLTY